METEVGQTVSEQNGKCKYQIFKQKTYRRERERESPKIVYTVVCIASMHFHVAFALVAVPGRAVGTPPGVRVIITKGHKGNGSPHHASSVIIVWEGGDFIHHRHIFKWHSKNIKTNGYTFVK